MERFLHEHKTKAPTRGSCRMVASDALALFLQQSDAKGMTEVYEMMKKDFSKRMDDCGHLNSLMSKFPYETILELKKDPNYHMPIKEARKVLKEDQNSFKADSKRAGECLEELTRAMPQKEFTPERLQYLRSKAEECQGLARIVAKKVTRTDLASLSIDKI
jgi:hypothetical protein